jgi:hypothetical protein
MTKYGTRRILSAIFPSFDPSSDRSLPLGGQVFGYETAPLKLLILSPVVPPNARVLFG